MSTPPVKMNEQLQTAIARNEAGFRDCLRVSCLVPAPKRREIGKVSNYTGFIKFANTWIHQILQLLNAIGRDRARTDRQLDRCRSRFLHRVRSFKFLTRGYHHHHFTLCATSVLLRLTQSFSLESNKSLFLYLWFFVFRHSSSHCQGHPRAIIILHHHSHPFNSRNYYYAPFIPNSPACRRVLISTDELFLMMMMCVARLHVKGRRTGLVSFPNFALTYCSLRSYLRPRKPPNASIPLNHIFTLSSRPYFPSSSHCLWLQGLCDVHAWMLKVVFAPSPIAFIVVVLDLSSRYRSSRNYFAFVVAFIQ